MNYNKLFRERYENGFEYELPSGVTVKLRELTVDVLINEGRLTNVLQSEAGKNILFGQDSLGVNNTETLVDAANAKHEFYRAVCTAAFVEPKIVDNPKDDNEIKFEWLPHSDVEAVVELMNRPVNEWYSFRSETN